MTTVKNVAAADRELAVAVVVRAFSADPAARWLYPDTRQYLEHFPNFVKVFAGAAFEHDSAYFVDGGHGAALWLPPGVHADEKALSKLVRDTITGRGRAEVSGFFEQMEKWHPPEPHWYLPMIGVDPAQQSTGYGSTLLKHALKRCDSENRLAYLEASSSKSVPLYERHGFAVLGTIQAGSSPKMFPMLRKPRPFTGATSETLPHLKTSIQA